MISPPFPTSRSGHRCVCVAFSFPSYVPLSSLGRLLASRPDPNLLDGACWASWPGWVHLSLWLRLALEAGVPPRSLPPRQCSCLHDDLPRVCVSASAAHERELGRSMSGVWSNQCREEPRDQTGQASKRGGERGKEQEGYWVGRGHWIFAVLEPQAGGFQVTQWQSQWQQMLVRRRKLLATTTIARKPVSGSNTWSLVRSNWRRGDLSAFLGASRRVCTDSRFARGSSHVCNKGRFIINYELARLPSQPAPLSSTFPLLNMEVANFSSALTQASRAESPQWLAASAKRDLGLVLPDGTTLSLVVGFPDISPASHSSQTSSRSAQGADGKTNTASGGGSSSSSSPLGHDLVAVHVALQKQLHQAGASYPNAAGRDGDASSAVGRQPMSDLLPVGGFPFALQCRPPKKKFHRPEDEPDDNTLPGRSSRFALAQLDTSKVHPDWSLAEKLAYVWAQLYVIVSMLPAEEAFNVAIASNTTGTEAEPDGTDSSINEDIVQGLLDANVAIEHPVKSTIPGIRMLILFRSTFWQNASPFTRPPWLLTLGHGTKSLTGHITTTIPDVYTLTRGVYHPQRPRKPTPADGPLYTRYVMELGETLSFEAVSSKDEAFVDLFTKWHADERVNAGWRQRGTKDQQRTYLAKLEASADVLPLVAKWNGVPFGYIEAYWAKESNIGTYYSAGDYDRGMHVLVGDSRFRGPHRVRSWMGSAFHMLFCLDPRTERVVLEPRASNAKMINYVTMCGAHVEKVSHPTIL